MADKRISQLVDRGTVANNDVVPIVVSGATTTNKATISSIQTFMQGNLDLGVTSVGITLGSSGTDVSVSGSPITSSGNITINIPTASATNRGLLSAADWVTFNSKQDAGSFVTLDTAQTITAQKTFTTSGSSDTMIISHGSGSGFALDVLKAGNGEAIRVTKTSGSGNAMTISGGNFEAGTIVKTGGTSSQFLKADGSIDSTAYTTNTGTVTSVSGTGTVSGLSLSGTVTTSGNLTLGGTLSLTSANVTDALGFTPYNATNPAGYTTNVGTVTSVAALTLGTSGTDLSSTVANGTTTPVITLNVPTASAANRGALSAADWTTFNGKQPALNGTGFVKISGTTISYDNSTYLTTGTAASTYLPLAGGTLTGALNGTSATMGIANVQNWNTISTFARFGHSSYNTGTNYGYLQDSSGNVFVEGTSVNLSTTSGNVTNIGGALNGTSASFTSGITLAGAAGTSIFTSFSVGGTTYGYNGLSGSSGSVITGSVLGDMVIRTVNKSILFSTNDGSTSALTIAASTGEATFSGALNGTSATFGGLITGQTTSNATITQNFLAYNSGTSVSGASYDFASGGTAQTARISANYEASSPDRMAMRFLVGQGSGLVELLKLYNNTMTVTGAATFSSSVTAATAINVTGNGGFFNAANKFGLDHFGGASRFYSSGSNSSTKGSYEFHTNSSDGSLDVIALGIASTGAATFSSTVQTTGIKFPATQVASADANTLDDYEEGTWTPDVDAQTGTYTMVFGSKGTYTKIGRVVTVQYYFRVVNKGTGSGRCILSNLPFASLTTSTDDSYTGTGIRQGNYLNTLVINQNSSSINILENGGDPIVQGQWNAGSITYFT
jgi:hypothetical protein